MTGAETDGTGLDGTHVDVLIVGAGFAGLGMGIRLARRGMMDFLILERGSDVGGTWRDNTYPGVACDIPSHLYSFSFRQKPDWSRVFAPGAEIQEYLRESAREEGLLPRLRLNTAVTGMRWEDERWIVGTGAGTVSARVVVMAAGRLSEPRLPEIEGLDTFTGDAFHSAHWDHDARLDGKRVGVVGTGSSALQLVPKLAGRAGELVVFQRSAAWVVPRGDRAYTDAERRLFALDPEVLDDSRSRYFWTGEEAFAQRIGLADRRDALETVARQHLERQVADPALRAALTPDYEIGCKRVVISDDFYPALSMPGVRLEASSLARLDGGTAMASSGERYELDALVFATGFESTQPAYAPFVTGRDGVRLSERWSEGMTSYASTAVHGFPNLFILDGPNASLGHNSAIFMIEAQIDHVLGALAHLADTGATALEPSAEAEAAYTARIDELAGATVWLNGGCTSWYVDERSRRLTLLWPDFAHAFREVNGTFRPEAYEQIADSRRSSSAAGAYRGLTSS